MFLTALVAGAYLAVVTPLIVHVTPASPAVRATAIGSLTGAAVLAAISVDAGSGIVIALLSREVAAVLGAVMALVLSGYSAAALTHAEIDPELQAIAHEHAQQVQIANSRLDVLAG